VGVAARTRVEGSFPLYLFHSPPQAHEAMIPSRAWAVVGYRRENAGYAPTGGGMGSNRHHANEAEIVAALPEPAG
jgi:hypothetical protein